MSDQKESSRDRVFSKQKTVEKNKLFYQKPELVNLKTPTVEGETDGTAICDNPGNSPVAL